MQEEYEALKAAVLNFIETYDAYWTAASNYAGMNGYHEEAEEMNRAFDDMAALVETEPEIP